MKSIFRLPLLILVLGFTAGSSYGTTFNYSYTFEDGLEVSGTLDGTQNGNFVDNVSNVSLFFDGGDLSGTIYTSMYDGLNYLSGPVVSFDALQNNFLFATSDLAGGDFAYNSIFYMLNSSVFEDTALAFSTAGAGYASQDFPTSSGRWSLTVPDGGSTIIFMALSMAGLAWIRRKSSKASAASACFEGGRAVIPA